ncbi:MAG: hypothetical protein A2W80_08320 [Candidatus Riflebacteria bacterium GWC2_50_8]|nr:MAG: hypothetical protein A2W80_08320 [Candidatus Riflebacteria bacterium GWC2_50_8]
MLSHHSKTSATTLVEILVATTILAFTMAPIVAIFTFASRSMGSSVHRIQAQFLAHAVLESIKAETHRYPAAINQYPSRFEVSAVRKPLGFFSTSRVNFFNNVLGQDKPITPDSPLYKEFDQFRIIVTILGTGKVSEISVAVEWAFDGKNQKLEIIGKIDSRPYRFSKIERY